MPLRRVLKISNNVYGLQCNEYTNGIETTAGFVKTEDVEYADSDLPVTYDSQHALMLPVNFYDCLWLDDRNKRMKLKEVLFENADKGDPIFVMEDGYISGSITE